MWSEERTALLRKLWAEGLSASQIAKQLGGTTRNAVIGKVHRLGLAGRATPSRPAKRPVRHRPASLIRAPRFNPEKPPKQGPDLAAIAALPPIDPALGVCGLTAFTCRYPIGNPDDPSFAFCGRTCNNIENPYCVQHQKLAYTPANKRRRDATLRLANWLDTRTFKIVEALAA